MKRRHTQTATDDIGIDLAPMLDVIFILLIFFIVTATFVKQTGIEVSTPNARTAVVQERGSILVALDSSNQIWINRRRADISSVRANIERLHAEHPQATVVIQADENSRNGTLVEVLDQVKLAGIPNMAIAATRSE